MVFAQETFLGIGSARCELIIRQGARIRGGGRSPWSAEPLALQCCLQTRWLLISLLPAWVLEPET